MKSKITKRIILFFLLAFCGIARVSAQQLTAQWAIATLGGQSVVPTEMIIDHTGNIINAGFISDIVDLNPGSATYSAGIAGETCMYVQKLDPNGNFIWGAAFNSHNAFSNNYIGLDIDSDDNIYTTGYFEGTTDFDPGTGVYNLSQLCNSADAFILKLTSSGTFAWVKQLGTVGSNICRGTKLDIDGFGNIYSIGSFTGAIDFDPGIGVSSIAGSSSGYVHKLDSDGNFVWVKENIQISNNSLDTDMVGNILIGGTFNGTRDFDPSLAVFNLTGINDVFAQKLDQNGNLIWAISFGSTNIDYCSKLKTDHVGAVYLTGYFRGLMDVDPGSGQHFMNTTTSDSYVIKFDAGSNYIWSRQIESTLNSGVSLNIDNLGNTYVTGHFAGNAVFTTGTPEISTLPLTKSDIYLMKINPSGDFVSVITLGGSGDDVGRCIALHSGTGSLYLSGIFTNTMDADPGSGVINLTASAAITQGFLIKFSTCTANTTIIALTACSSYTVPSGHETYTVSGTYMDTIPNATGCDSIITINLTISDGIAPVADLVSLADVTNQCSVASLTAPTATDNCAGTITGTTTTTFPITTPGTTVVTWTYADGNGNTSTQTQNVIIADNTAPVANTASLADVTNQCSVASLTAPTATDNCAGLITATTTTTFPINASGTTVVTWTYADGNGNTSTQTQNVIIADNTAPVANTASLADVTNQCSVASLTAPTATDNCAGTITGTTTTTFPITLPGTTVVTWTYDDGNGNTSTQTQNVIIADNTAPVANTASLADVMDQCSVASLTAPTATDNCAGTITGTTTTTFPITTPGTTVVTWTYDDGNGNTATQTQNVIITLPSASTTLSGLTISATTSGAAYQWINCGTGNTPIAGATAQSFTATANGTYAVIVTQNGCSATSSCVTISTVDLKEQDKLAYAVYPNPNNGRFTLSATSPLQITITNTAGQIVLKNQIEPGQHDLELPDVESGIYFIHASNETGQSAINRISVIR